MPSAANGEEAQSSDDDDWFEESPIEGQEEDTELVRCSVSKGSWRCARVFPFELAFFRGQWQPLKHCLHHRELQRAKNKRPTSRACQKRARESEAGRASYAKQLESPARKASRSAYAKTEKGREQKRKSNKTPAGRARQKRNSDKQHAKLKTDPARKMMHQIRCRLREFMRQADGDESVTLATHTSLPDRDGVRAHMESTFVDGMNWSNYGWRGENIWNIGHCIAQSMYDWSSPDDRKRCFSLANLFAQWSIENQDANVALPQDDVLLRLRPFWPVAWNDQLPSATERPILERAARNTAGLTR